MIPKIGSIDFLNADPLCQKLAEVESRWEIIADLPSVLANSLRMGDLDVALVPQVEACRNENYKILPGYCISCDGPVGSILLFGDKPWDQLEKVSVDHASNSSVQLLSVLRHLDGLSPLELKVGPSNLSALEDQEQGESVLLIGDSALEHAVSSVPRLDLGMMWKERTGLPFVFAFWLSRGPIQDWIVESIRKTAQLGLADRTSIAEKYCQKNPGILDVPAAVDYLHEKIRYDLGEPQIEAISEFHRLRCELDNSLDPGWKPEFLQSSENGTWS